MELRLYGMHSLYVNTLLIRVLSVIIQGIITTGEYLISRYIYVELNRMLHYCRNSEVVEVITYYNWAFSNKGNLFEIQI